MGEITEILSSKRIHKNDYIDSGIPFYRTTEIKELSENKAISRCLYIAKTQYDSIKDKFGVPNRGDILISAVGTIGITWIVENDNPFYFKDGNLIWIKQSQVLISNYLSWLLFHFVRVQNYILTSGSAYNALTIEKLAELIIPLPPLAEQKRIVAEIDKYFALIDEIEQNKTDLAEAITQTKSKILDLAIHGKLVPQDPNDEPAIKLLKRINPNFTPCLSADSACDNEHYKNLPTGWAVCQLDDIINYEQPQTYIVNSTDYNNSYSTPVLTAGKSFVIGYTNESNNIYTKLPCIIFDDFTTDSKFVDFPFKVKSSAMKILTVSKEINIRFVAFFMSITRLMGDTHKRYWISEYSKLTIPLPPKNEQDRIIRIMDKLFEKLDTIAENL